MLEDGEFGTQKESLTGRIVRKEDYQDRHHFLLRESGLEVLLVAIKRSCENVVLVEHGLDVRVTGSPGKSKGMLCLYADSFSILAPCLLNLKEKEVSASTIEEPKRHKHFEKLSTHKFQWKVYNGVEILQPSIKQNVDMCAFAAVVKQLDYQLRMLYADVGISLTKECIFNHKKWEDDLRKEYPKQTRWKPIELLREAKANGVPLWNGGNHAIQFSRCISNNSLDTFLELQQLLQHFPVIGVLTIYDNYDVDGKDIYVKGKSVVTEKRIKTNAESVEDHNAYHSVVLIDAKKIDNELYVAYQNSDGDPEKAMCDFNVCWVEASLIVEIAYGCSLPPVHPPSALQTKEQIKSVLGSCEIVRTGLSSSNEIFQKGKNLIDQINKSRWSKARDENEYKNWEKKVITYIAKIGLISRKMKNFIGKYEGVEDAAAAGLLEVPKLLVTCQDAGFIDDIAANLQSLLQNALR